MHQSPVEFALRSAPSPDEKSKQQTAERAEKDNLADKKTNKKNKDKKKQIVGIRKRVVPSENPEGGVIIKESFLVRVDSSSSDALDNDAKDDSDDGSDTEVPVNVQLTNKNRKPGKK